MHRIALPERGTFEAWRDAARTLAGHDIPPEAVEWTLGDAGAGLFGSDPLPAALTVGNVALNWALVWIGNFIGGGLLIGGVYAWLNNGPEDYRD